MKNKTTATTRQSQISSYMFSFLSHECLFVCKTKTQKKRKVRNPLEKQQHCIAKPTAASLQLRDLDFDVDFHVQLDELSPVFRYCCHC